jgi:hypothetical protein
MSMRLQSIAIVATLCRMKRRKPLAQRKEDTIRIRVTTEQKRTLIDRAQRDGLEVSAWLRSLGLREAAQGA